MPQTTTNLYDVVIIGAGVSGCSVARELSRYDMSVIVVEAEEDVCCGTSRANSAIVHAGFDATPGTLMGRLGAKGAHLMSELCEELGVDYEQNGSLVVCCDEEGIPHLHELVERGKQNAVVGLRVIGRAELQALEPNISDAAVAALWAPTGAIVNPFQLTCALAENAAANGVEFRRLWKVERVERDRAHNEWQLFSPTESLRARVVVNAAGLHADDLHNQVSSEPLTIVARRGEYLVLDTTAGNHVRHTVFALPGPRGKGVLVTPTTGGNLLVGPTALDIEDKGATCTTEAGIAEVLEKAALTVAHIPVSERIRSFSGLRAHRAEHDFLIQEAPDAPGFVDCAAIESPGLSASPAIGKEVARIVANILDNPVPKTSWCGRRERPVEVARAPRETWAQLCEKRADYGRVICRCRHVTEGEIVDAIHRNPGARSLDGIKRRTDAGLGRCQGGFCSPKIMELLAREVDDLNLGSITKAGPGSELIVGTNKDSFTREAQ